MIFQILLSCHLVKFISSQIIIKRRHKRNGRVVDTRNANIHLLIIYEKILVTVLVPLPEGETAKNTNKDKIIQNKLEIQKILSFRANSSLF